MSLNVIFDPAFISRGAFTRVYIQYVFPFANAGPIFWAGVLEIYGIIYQECSLCHKLFLINDLFLNITF